MTILVLQDKYGKPVAFREKVAAAKTIVVQVCSLEVQDLRKSRYAGTHNITN